MPVRGRRITRKAVKFAALAFGTFLIKTCRAAGTVPTPPDWACAVPVRAAIPAAAAIPKNLNNPWQLPICNLLIEYPVEATSFIWNSFSTPKTPSSAIFAVGKNLTDN
jgi:hypothetical protein